MNECCDWHGICLNENEETQVNNLIKKVYLSYCPECNSIFQCLDDKVLKIEGAEKAEYMRKYQDKINTSNKMHK